jgi:uncharacterized membrane protein YcaP (DUF421 family)
MDWAGMFFQGWEGVVRVLVVGVLAYASLVAFLRISGKRTLAKLNAFDLVVTVALGSTLAAILLQQSVALLEGVAALLLLVALQLVVTFTSVRSRTFARAIRSEPALLARRGELCEETMKRERITLDEAMSALRANGGHELEQIDTMSDGSISVRLR